VSEELEVPGTGIRVTVAEVFAELDELEGNDSLLRGAEIRMAQSASRRRDAERPVVS